MTLSNTDLKQVRTIVKEELNRQEKRFGQRMDEKLDEQEEKFEKKLTEFKSDFFTKIDPILKEVTTAKEERPLIENRLEKLEKIHPKGKHVLAS